MEGAILLKINKINKTDNSRGTQKCVPLLDFLTITASQVIGKY